MPHATHQQLHLCGSVRGSTHRLLTSDELLNVLFIAVFQDPDGQFAAFPSYNREVERYAEILEEKEALWEEELKKLMQKSDQDDSSSDSPSVSNKQTVSEDCKDWKGTAADVRDPQEFVSESVSSKNMVSKSVSSKTIVCTAEGAKVTKSKGKEDKSNSQTVSCCHREEQRTLLRSIKE